MVTSLALVQYKSGAWLLQHSSKSRHGNFDSFNWFGSIFVMISLKHCKSKNCWHSAAWFFQGIFVNFATMIHPWNQAFMLTSVRHVKTLKHDRGNCIAVQDPRQLGNEVWFLYSLLSTTANESLLNRHFGQILSRSRFTVEDTYPPGRKIRVSNLRSLWKSGFVVVAVGCTLVLWFC